MRTRKDIFFFLSQVIEKSTGIVSGTEWPGHNAIRAQHSTSLGVLSLVCWFYPFSDTLNGSEMDLYFKFQILIPCLVSKYVK